MDFTYLVCSLSIYFINIGTYIDCMFEFMKLACRVIDLYYFCMIIDILRSISIKNKYFKLQINNTDCFVFILGKQTLFFFISAL
jgi:hypothetical protein